MRHLIILLSLLTAIQAKADTIDLVEVYVNGKHITTANIAIDRPMYFKNELKIGDTVQFYVIVDWDDLLNAKIQLSSDDADLISEVNRLPGQRGKPLFQFIIGEEHLNKEINVTVDYNVHKMRPWNFLRLNINGTKEE